MSIKMEKVKFGAVPVLQDSVYKPKVLAEDQIGMLKNYILGRVLTIVDASIADKEQRKAIKDLVREAVWDKEYFTKSILNIVEGKPPYDDNCQTIEAEAFAGER